MHYLILNVIGKCKFLLNPVNGVRYCPPPLVAWKGRPLEAVASPLTSLKPRVGKVYLYDIIQNTGGCLVKM